MVTELLLLKLRIAVADKEWNIACANMDVAHYGTWTCDWNIGMMKAQDDIDKILHELEKKDGK